MPTSASRPAPPTRRLRELLVAELHAGQRVGRLRVRPRQRHRHVEVVGAGGEGAVEDRHDEAWVDRVEDVADALCCGTARRPRPRVEASIRAADEPRVAASARRPRSARRGVVVGDDHVLEEVAPGGDRTAALPTPPAPMTRMRTPLLLFAGRQLPGTSSRCAGEAVMELGARAVAQVPGATAHVRATIDDRHRQRDALVAEGHERAARERPMGDADERLGQGLAARRAIAVEARAVPRDVRVVTPDVLADRAGGRFVLGMSNRSRWRLGSHSRLDEHRALVQGPG